MVCSFPTTLQIPSLLLSGNIHSIQSKHAWHGWCSNTYTMTMIIHFSTFQEQHVTMGSEKLPAVSRRHTISDLLIKWIQQVMTLSLHYVWFVWLLHTSLLCWQTMLRVMGVQKKNCSHKPKTLEEEENYHCQNHLMPNLMWVIQDRLHSQEPPLPLGLAGNCWLPLPWSVSLSLLPLIITVNSWKISTSAYQPETMTLALMGSLILLAV